MSEGEENVSLIRLYDMAIEAVDLQRFFVNGMCTIYGVQVDINLDEEIEKIRDHLLVAYNIWLMASLKYKERDDPPTFVFFPPRSSVAAYRKLIIDTLQAHGGAMNCDELVNECLRTGKFSKGDRLYAPGTKVYRAVIALYNRLTELQYGGVIGINKSLVYLNSYKNVYGGN